MMEEKRRKGLLGAGPDFRAWEPFPSPGYGVGMVIEYGTC